MNWLEYDKILDTFFNQKSPKLPGIFVLKLILFLRCFKGVIVCNISLVSMFDKKYFLWSLIFCKIRLYLAKISEKSWFSFIAFFLHPFFAKDFLLWHFLHDAKNVQLYCGTSTVTKLKNVLFSKMKYVWPFFRYFWLNLCFGLKIGIANIVERKVRFISWNKFVECSFSSFT